MNTINSHKLSFSANSELKNHTSLVEGILKNSKEINQSRKGRAIPGFAREIIIKVAEVCQAEAKKNCPMFSLTAPTKRAAMYTGVSERTIQRIRLEDKKSNVNPGNKINKLMSCLDKQINYNTIKKHGHRGQFIPESARDIISRVIHSCYTEYQDGEYLAPLICKSKRTALYTGVSVRTIQRIKQEDEIRNKLDQAKLLTTPGRRRRRSTIREKIDDFDFHCIRMLLDEIILHKKVYPTCSSLLQLIKDSNITFPYGEDTLSRLLYSKGFNWKSGPKGKKILVEREEIFRNRVNIIRKIKNHEAEGKSIVYLDDRWIGVDPDNIYCDRNDIFGTSGGICCSGRIIVLTKFSAMGIARRAFKIFRPNSTYSDPPPIAFLEEWLKDNVFKKIPHNSLFIMSIDSYSQNNINIPNEYSNKTTLIEYLKSNKVKYDGAQTWADLYGILKKYLESLPSRWGQIDKIIEKYGHITLRLPSYMSEFNPIELACANVNRYLQEKNTTVKASFKCIKENTLKAVQQFQIETFQGYVNRIVKLEDYFLDNEKSLQEHYDSDTKTSNEDKILNYIDDKYTSIKKTDVNELTKPNFITSSGSHDLVSNDTLDNISTDAALPLNSHMEIFYGKSVAIPVFFKPQNLQRGDMEQPEPSYLNL